MGCMFVVQCLSIQNAEKKEAYEKKKKNLHQFESKSPTVSHTHNIHIYPLHATRTTLLNVDFMALCGISGIIN